jgi:hypothetical protein
VTIDIAAVNDPPRATDDFVGIDPDTPLTFPVLGNDSDVEGETITLRGHSDPEHGEAEIVDNKLRYAARLPAGSISASGSSRPARGSGLYCPDPVATLSRSTTSTVVG